MAANLIPPLRVGSLFAGIGGFDLGFERAGMTTAWFVEKDPYCQAVLRKHWPEVPIHEDVRTVSSDTLTPVDVLCGGFPCQDISSAGSGAGLDGSRSGLWSEFHRLIADLRPRWVIVENVSFLRSRGLGRILGEMAEIGYDAEWDCVPAQAVGAPHRRDRIWIVAYPHSEGEHDGPVDAEVGGSSQLVADTTGERGRSITEPSRTTRCESGELGHERGVSRGWPAAWPVEPNVGRVAHGVPARMDRLRSLGNALVPQIAEEIGRRIVAHG